MPAAAPWLALRQAIDYEREVAPAHAFPIHTAVLSDEGLLLHLRLLESMGPAGTTWHAGDQGTTLQF